MKLASDADQGVSRASTPKNPSAFLLEASADKPEGVPTTANPRPKGSLDGRNRVPRRSKGSLGLLDVVGRGKRVPSQPLLFSLVSVRHRNPKRMEACL